MLKEYLLLSGLIIFLLSSCRKKDDPVAASTTSQLEMTFTNTVDGQPLVLGSKRYKNANGDSFSVRTYRYYISNVSFNTASGSYAVPNCYQLVTEGVDSTRKLVINNVPEGNYVSVTFLIGVDKEHNTSGAQAGYLDFSYGMLWTWETGYIMAKLEGDYTNATGGGGLAFHISGFDGDDNVLKWVTLPLPQSAVVAKGKLPIINIESNVNEWFVNPAIIDFAVTHDVTSTGRFAVAMANNYADMFSVKSVVN